MVTEVTFRITEGSDSRTTELGDFRIIEDGNSSANLLGSCDITATSNLISKVTTNLLGEVSSESTATLIPFVSTCYAKVNGVWKVASPYVKSNNLWQVPVFGAIKINGIWKRVL